MRVALLLILVAVSNVDAAVTGSVMDAQTGAPIQTFSTVARPDNPRSIWQQHTVQQHTDGHFAITRRLWESSQIRVWADGYRPGIATVKRDDPRKLEFRLERDPGLRGSVVNENGKPVAGATVALATFTSEPTISKGKMTLSGSATKMGLKTVETAADGSFVLPGEIDPATVVVVHENGCAE